MYGAFVLFLIVLFGRETYASASLLRLMLSRSLHRMYDRGEKNLPPRPADGLRYRIETLVGLTGAKMAKHRATWHEAVSAPFKLLWRPHLLSITVFEVPHCS